MPHKSPEQIHNEFRDAAKAIIIGGIYSHYKNPQHHYKVHNFAVQEATDKLCVVYEALYNPGILFIRDVDQWLTEVVVNGKKQKRFTFISS